jgi:antirestriction protein ArdC
MNDSPKFDTYRLVTQRFMELLDQGVVPWRKMWRPQLQRPGLCNGVSGHHYRGSNVLLLGFEMLRKSYEHPYWLTWNQIKNLGGSVRKGEGGAIITFFRDLTVQSTQEKANAATGKLETLQVEKTIPLLRFTKVWNVGQTREVEVERLPAHQQWLKKAAEQPVRHFEPIEAAQTLVHAMPTPPLIRHGIDRPGYLPSLDAVVMPHPEQYDPPEEYYATLFHELGHATGHPKRLAREGIMDRPRFGDVEYSREELIAEITGGFLSAVAGISDNVIANQAAYLNGWRQAMDAEPKLIIQAASKAQQASDYVLGITQAKERSPSTAPNLQESEARPVEPQTEACRVVPTRPCFPVAPSETGHAPVNHLLTQEARRSRRMHP